MLSRGPERNLKSIALTDRSEMTPCTTAFFFLTAAFNERWLHLHLKLAQLARDTLKLENDKACLSLRRGSKRTGNCLRFGYWKGKTSAVCFQSINSNAIISSLRFVIQSPAEVLRRKTSSFPVKRSKGVGQLRPFARHVRLAGPTRIMEQESECDNSGPWDSFKVITTYWLRSG